MPVKFTDSEIEGFIKERKPLPRNNRSRLNLRLKRDHRERELDICGDAGNQYRLIMRESLSNALDFSVVLALSAKGTTELFRLGRYNGKSHEHTNILEGESFHDFHIHMATARYQDFGSREDSFAERTDRYSDFQEAVTCLPQDCGFDDPPVPEPQQGIF